MSAWMVVAASAAYEAIVVESQVFAVMWASEAENWASWSRRLPGSSAEEDGYGVKAFLIFLMLRTEWVFLGREPVDRLVS